MPNTRSIICLKQTRARLVERTDARESKSEWCRRSGANIYDVIILSCKFPFIVLFLDESIDSEDVCLST